MTLKTLYKSWTILKHKQVPCQVARAFLSNSLKLWFKVTWCGKTVVKGLLLSRAVVNL